MSSTTDTPITCLHCRHWNLREVPALARYGFGACGQGRAHTVYSGTRPRICIRFAGLPAEDAKKRQEWLNRHRQQPTKTT